LIADDALYWSDDLVSWLPGDDDCDSEGDVPPDYLFRGGAGYSAEFITIANEMAQLNDYCVMCVLQTRKHLDWLRQELSDLECGRQRVVSAFGDYTERAVTFVSGEIRTWENTYGFVTRAMCLLLLSAFTEKSLKTLSMAFAPAGQRLARSRKRPDESEIAHYLRFLRETCGLEFAEPEESIAAREACRHIRNDFAHGEWDKVTQHVSHVGLRGAFSAVANLLKGIEASAWARQTAGQGAPSPPSP
jgi:hypothetical protein